MGLRDVISWTSMMSAYLICEVWFCYSLIFQIHQAHNQPKATLFLFSKMKNEGITPDAVTYTYVIAAAVDLVNLSIGKQVYYEIKVAFPFQKCQ